MKKARKDNKERKILKKKHRYILSSYYLFDLNLVFFYSLPSDDSLVNHAKFQQRQSDVSAHFVKKKLSRFYAMQYN